MLFPFFPWCLPLAIGKDLSTHQQDNPVQLSPKDCKSDFHLPFVSNNILLSFAGWDLWSYWQWQVIPVFGVLQNGRHI